MDVCYTYFWSKRFKLPKDIPEYTLMYSITALLRRCRFSIPQKDIDMSTNEVYNTKVDNATSICGRLFYVEPFCSLFACNF